MGPAEWLMFVILSAIWGCSFYFFAVVIKELPVFTIVFFRVFLATIVLWLIVLITHQQLPPFSKVWRNYLMMGLFNNVIPFSLIVWGENRVAPGLAAVLNATTPFFTVLVAHVSASNERLTWNRLMGAVIGLAGVAGLVGFDALKNLGSDLLFQLAIIGASVCYAISSIFGRRFSGISPIVSASAQTTASSLMLFPLMMLIDRPLQLPAPSITAVLYLLGLSLMCTALAYIIFYNIVKRAGMTNVTLVTFLVPISAMFLGAMFLSEQISARHFLGMATIGLGLALIDGRIPRKLTILARG
jgi:drug/metabolite transporter (DMT)-like permease